MYLSCRRSGVCRSQSKLTHAHTHTTTIKNKLNIISEAIGQSMELIRSIRFTSMVTNSFIARDFWITSSEFTLTLSR